MPKYEVGVAVRVWLTKQTYASTREIAEARVLKQAEKLMADNGFAWYGGNVEHVQTTDMTLLKKIPF